MDWSQIGVWAGDKGPYLAIIALQFRIIWMLLDRFFQQQKILTDAIDINARAVQVAEKAAPEKV